jgi:hypothetical protein
LSREAERFAEKLVREVRDEAIDICDRLLTPKAASRTATRWRSADAVLDAIASTRPPCVLNRNCGAVEAVLADVFET